MKVYDAVRKQIMQDLEKMEPHARLPGRQALCDQYFVSRDTMDRIISGLCRDGYLYTIRNSGTFVSDPSISLNISRKLPPYAIGVLMPTSGINSSAYVIQGINDYVEKNKLHVVKCITDHNPEKLESYIRRLIISGISGLLIQPPSVIRSYAEVTALIERANIPTVFMFNTFPNMSNHPLITPNYIQPSCFEHVYERGYRRLAYVSNHGHFSRDSSLRVYLSVQAKRQVADPFRYVLIEDYIEREQFVRKICQMLSLPDHPDAFFCFNDTEAGMVYEAIRRSNLRVSDDIGVIGTDNSPVAAQMDPPLTSVDIGAYDIGYTGISWVDQLVKEGYTPYKRMKAIEPWLVNRVSCLGPENRE